MEFEGKELLVARLAPGNAALYLASRMHELPKRNVTNFFGELEGEKLTGASIAKHDRLVQLSFGGYSLYLRFYDKPNALLFCDRVYVSAFKKVEDIPLVPPQESSLQSALSLLSAPLRKELAFRGSNADEFEKELRASHLVYSYKSSIGPIGHIGLISPIRLTGLGATPEGFANPSQSIEYAITQREKTKAFESKRHELLAHIDRFIDKTAAARTEAEQALSDSSRIDRSTLIGQEILAQAAELQRGVTSITYNEKHAAELDPALTPYENANRYFEKARTAKARKDDVAKRIEALASDENLLYTFRERIVEAKTLKDLDEIKKALAQSRFTLHQVTETLGEAGPRFREFEVAGGLRVFIGKNAKQNDELTLHFAHKEDLWFHARHVSGSHVVLRTGKQTNIPPRAIEQAAELAAYFSDAKTQGHAPVAYTRRKYVRKPRGASTGAVKIEREEVIIVTPQISAKQIS